MGGKTEKAPTPYQPTGQAQADQGYQNLVAGATPYAQDIASTVVPGLQQTAANVTANPYYDYAQQGANTTANNAQYVAGAQYGAASDLYGLGGLAAVNALPMAQAAAGAGQQAYDQTQAMIPSATRGAGMAQGAYDSAQAMINPTTLAGLYAANPALFSGFQKANETYGAAMSAIPGLTGGMDSAQRILDTGFDPQGDLYNRQYQQQMDQQNALNAMYGMGGSAYGAGLAGDASRNFNIDWQNTQLQRQIAAMGAYGQQQGQVAQNLTGLLGSAAGNYANLSNAGVNQYTGLTSNAANNYANLSTTGTNNFNNLNNSAVNNLNSLTTTGNGAMQAGLANASNIFQQLADQSNQSYTAAGQQGTDALNTQMAASQLPSSTYLAQQQAQIAALQALAQGGGQALAPTESLIDDQGQYLGIGQAATAGAQNAAKINSANSAGAGAGIGRLLGTVAGGVLGFAAGGPLGAIVGAQAGSKLI